MPALLPSAIQTPAAHRRQISHALRRLQMAVWPGQVEELQDLTIAEAIQTIIDRDQPFLLDDDDAYAELEAEMVDGRWDTMSNWYLSRLADPAAGLHERMVWFWHNHLTSSVEETSRRNMIRQHRLFRQHALGNFRDLLQAVTVDAAMLDWLNGNGSEGHAPNENYAREMMELFALGTGHYTEDDIRAAARGLSGWNAHWETSEVTFDPEEHYNRPTSFMGQRRVWTAADIVNRVCDHPACARHVSAALYRHLVGSEPTESVLDELATTFRDSGLELQSLVLAIVAQPSFAAGIPARTRTSAEWMTATMAIFGPDNVPVEAWWLEQMGQMLFEPPNVAGWPTDDRWAGAAQVLARVSILTDLEMPESVILAVDPTVDSVLAYCGIHEPSTTTRAAMQQAIDQQTEFDYGLELLFVLALTSPEFAYL